MKRFTIAFLREKILTDVRYALACRYHAMESPWIAIDKLKHIGHLSEKILQNRER
jgi:hypothetical protein